MTKIEAINVHAQFVFYQELHLGTAKKTPDGKDINIKHFVLGDKVFYALTRSIRALKEIVTSHDSMKEDTMKLWKKSIEFDEENKDDAYIEDVNKQYVAHVTSKEVVETYNEFYKEDSGIELHKIGVDEIDSCIIPTADREFIEKYLVNK